MEEIYCCLSLCVCLSETTLLLLLLHSRKKTETKAPGIFLRLLARLTSSSLLSRSPAPRDGVDALDGYLSPYHSSLRLMGCPLLSLVPSVLIRVPDLDSLPSSPSLSSHSRRGKEEAGGGGAHDSLVLLILSVSHSIPSTVTASIHPSSSQASVVVAHARGAGGEESEGAREGEKEVRSETAKATQKDGGRDASSLYSFLSKLLFRFSRIVFDLIRGGVPGHRHHVVLVTGSAVRSAFPLLLQRLEVLQLPVLLVHLDFLLRHTASQVSGSRAAARAQAVNQH